MNFVCIVLDRLHWGYLGCYGNTWIATPALDRLAAEGFVFAQAHTESTDLAEVYNCLWRGSSVLQRLAQPAASQNSSLIDVARAHGLRTLLVTDDPFVAGHSTGAAFDEAVELDPPDADSPTAADAASTHIARLFTEAIDRTAADAAGAERPLFLWLHAQALAGPWDAPREYRDRYADEDDPPPPDFTAVPHETLPPDVDLDRRFGVAQAYAGQVTHIDACLGGFLEHLEETGLAENSAIVLLAPRGIALGEHGPVGPFDELVYGELVQTPCIVRLPDGRGRLRRSQALVQSSDWFHTLAELITGRQAEAAAPLVPTPRSVLPLVDDPTAAWRDRAIVFGAPHNGSGRREVGLRTPAWYLRRGAVAGSAADATTTEEPAADELFAKPDDAWEANDVADRCHDVVAMLHEAEAELRAAVAESRPASPLPEQLLHGLG
jgi:arylsulfatase A-like enzyme